jgi:hypothetical protein
VRTPRRDLIGVDHIFIYQFVVYLVVFSWGVFSLIEGDPTRASFTLAWAFVIAPQLTLAGYIIWYYRRRWRRAGLLVAAAGDAAMAVTIGNFATRVLHEHNRSGLSFLLAASLAACMLVRCLRDIAYVAGIIHDPAESSPSGS